MHDRHTGKGWREAFRIRRESGRKKRTGDRISRSCRRPDNRALPMATQSSQGPKLKRDKWLFSKEKKEKRQKAFLFVWDAPRDSTTLFSEPSGLLRIAISPTGQVGLNDDCSKNDFSSFWSLDPTECYTPIIPGSDSSA